jgi:hypothetical protein
MKQQAKFAQGHLDTVGPAFIWVRNQSRFHKFTRQFTPMPKTLLLIIRRSNVALFLARLLGSPDAPASG